MRSLVCFDGEIFWRQRYGGISRYFCSLAAALALRGTPPTIVAPLHRSRMLPTLRGVTVRGVSFSGPENLAERALTAANAPWVHAVWEAWLRPDVVHHTYYFAVPAQATRHVRRVVTIHDMIPELLPHLVLGAEHTVAAKRRAVANADHVICVSERTRSDLLNVHDIDPARVSVVYHGADDLPELGDEALHRSAGPPFVLYVGNRGGYKNFTTLVESLAACPALARDVMIIAFGGGPFTPEERSQFDRLKLGQRVEHCDGDDHTLVGLLHAAQAMVYPSLYEGFGLPPLEAMANGCPVISSNAASMPEVLGAAALFFDPTSVDELALRLEQVMSDPALRQDLVARGRERSRRFSWATSAEQTAAIYASLTG